MDLVVIGTTRNVEAEYGHGHEIREKFTLLHLFDGEPVSVEGFNTEAGILKAVEEYHGAQIERLFIELDA